MTIYGWMIEGSHQAFFGEFAEQDAKVEAARIGGTCKAFPIFIQKPLCFDNYDDRDDLK